MSAAREEEVFIKRRGAFMCWIYWAPCTDDDFTGGTLLPFLSSPRTGCSSRALTDRNISAAARCTVDWLRVGLRRAPPLSKPAQFHRFLLPPQKKKKKRFTDASGSGTFLLISQFIVWVYLRVRRESMNWWINQIHYLQPLWHGCVLTISCYITFKLLYTPHYLLTLNPPNLMACSGWMDGHFTPPASAVLVAKQKWL